MFSWGRRSKDPEPSILGFGKVPGTAEYVRCGRKSPASSHFEEWLVGAVEWATAFRAQCWKGDYDRAPAQSFLFRTCVDGQLVAGVIRPSRDSVGRRFPLVVGVHMHAQQLAAGIHLAPMLLSDFFRRADGLLSAAALSRSSSEFEGMVNGLSLPDFGRMELVTAQYCDWTRGTLASELFEQLFLGASANAAKRALHVIVDAAAPFKGKEAPKTSLSARVPLSQSASGPEVCSFWLDMVRRASGWKQTAPGFFATHGQSMLVQMGEPAHSSVLADAWIPDPGSDFVCDCVATASGSLLTPMPERLQAAMADPKCLLGDLLGQLAL